jgi:hypothetical protein
LDIWKKTVGAAYKNEISKIFKRKLIYMIKVGLIKTAINIGNGVKRKMIPRERGGGGKVSKETIFWMRR